MRTRSIRSKFAWVNNSTRRITSIQAKPGEFVLTNILYEVTAMNPAVAKPLNFALFFFLVSNHLVFAVQVVEGMAFRNPLFKATIEINHIVITHILQGKRG